MKWNQLRLWRWCRAAFVAGQAAIVMSAAAGLPTVTFSSPTNSQILISLAGIAGTARTTNGVIQSVTFRLSDNSSGQWWNGTNFQSAAFLLPTQLTGTNWNAMPGFVPPLMCCGRAFTLAAFATDSSNNVGTATITVITDSTAPVAAFAPLTNNQTVANLAAVGGTVVDNFGAVAAVTLNIREVDIHSGVGRWWNGTNFQGATINLPTVFTGTNWLPAPTLSLPTLNSGMSYQLTATTTDTTTNTSTTSITVVAPITALTWDPGVSPAGTALLATPNTNGGNYWFKITTQNPSVGVWRTALKVTVGEAGVYLRNVTPPTTNSFTFGSARPGSDGFTVDSSQFSPSQDWYLLVNATTNAQWTLMTGDIFVYDLGALAADASSGTNVTIAPESMAFFKTTAPADTLAWRLWLNGATNILYVKKSLAPHPTSYELIQGGAMLVVPPYLNSGTFNGTYFIGVPGVPGTALALDSRKQAVTDLGFGSPTNVTVTAADFPYVTYRVAVPVQQIAWQMNLLPTVGNANLAVRRDTVPNEFRNDGYSDLAGLVGDSVTLVPAPSGGTGGLTDGTFYITVYGPGTFATALNNGNPVITDVPYSFNVVNDATNRAGWRYYRVTDINQQLGSLGWELFLNSAPPGTEIALRRNVVPGRWNYRNADNNFSVGSLGYVDYSGLTGFLQRPGHQADIWYIGVYQPASALGAFQLTGQPLTGAPVAFDGAGNSTNILNQLPNRWQFCRIDVPTNSSVLGWDLRLQGVSGTGTPQMVVSRDVLPGSVNTTYVNYPNYWDTNNADAPQLSRDWPSGFQWAADLDWTGDYLDAAGNYAQFQTLTMGLGNPLQPGTYYVGVYNSSTGTNTTSYTLLSRGIGTNGQSIGVVDLGNNWITNVNGVNLSPREAAYYRVVVPSNAPSWNIKLTPTAGEALLVVQKGWLPNSGAAVWADPYTYESVSGQYQATRPTGGRKHQKAGNEHLVVLPYYFFETNVPAGVYYLAVVSEGVNPVSGRIGSNTVSYTLSSQGPVVTNQLGTVGAVDLVLTNAQEFGELTEYQFTVPPGVLSMEVRLENRVGNPWMTLKQTARLVRGDWNEVNCNYYIGDVNGESATWVNGNLITIAAPVPGTYTLAIATHPQPYNNCTPADAAYIVRVRMPNIPNLSFSPEFNTNGFTNVLGGVLADNQRAYFRVEVPNSVSNAPVLGWKLDLIQNSGTPSVHVRKGALPDDSNLAAATAFVAGSVAIVPAYLSAGTWYVEVKGSGNTDFTLVSSAITTNTLERPVWTMPALGEATITPGLSLPEFGDTGTATNGIALPGDRGVDLEQGRFHYYAILVPTNNAGLLRTELQAISGNPDLYLRAGAAPTLSHYTAGASGSVVYDRSLTGSQNSEYGNWVPLDGRTETRLTNGIWVLAVQAAGNSNVRYRLKLSCGNPVTNALVQQLPLDGTVLSGQNLAGRDWRYYRFAVPTNPPANYTFTFNRTLGGARVFVRDTTPPGDYQTIQNYDASPGSHYERDWYADNKNQGSYPRFDNPGTYTLTTPPLRPGHTYHLGVWSLTDSTFSLSLATNGPAVIVSNSIAFYGGYVTNLLPANSVALYRVEVPTEATRFKLFGTNSASIVFSLEQGTLAQTTGGAHWRSSGGDSSLNMSLTQSGWPWQPAYTYYLAVTNTSGSPTPFVVMLDGRNALTEDEDNDSLPDQWEMLYFGHTGYAGNSDPDGDGNNNFVELADGTNPNDGNSAKYFLTVTATNGVVTRNLTLPKYDKGTSVTLTALPDLGNYFIGWTGSTNSASSSLALIVLTNWTLNASFASQAVSIAVQPVGGQWFTGDMVTLTVTAFGQPQLGYQWRRYGTNLLTNANLAGLNSPSLVISNFQAAYAGDYTVVVSNAFNSVTSQVAVVFAPVGRTNLWQGTVSTDWFNPNNWSLGLVPTALDIVNLNSGTVLVTTNSVFGSLTWNGGAISGPLTVLPGSILNWTSGTLNADGAFTIAAGGVMNLSGSAAKTLFGVLTNAGTVLWTGTGNVNIYGPPSYNGRIMNLAGATFEAQNDQQLAAQTGTLPFYNSGTFRKSAGTGTTTFGGVSFTNSGTLEVLTGTLALTGPYNMTAGTLGFGLSSSTNYGQLNISGNAPLTGSLRATLLNGYKPATNASFPVMTFVSKSGAFTDISGLKVGNGRYFEPVFSATSLSLLTHATNNLTMTTPSRLSNGTFQFSITDELPGVYLLLGSTNLQTWSTLTTLTNTSGTLLFNDLSSTNQPRRFYRLQLLP